MSLVEVLFTIFFLSVSVLGVAGLYDAGLRIQGKIEQRMKATNIASSEMDKLRIWAATDDNFYDWTPRDGISYPAPNDSEFVVTIDSEPLSQFSPCTRIEMMMPSSQRRIMNSSARNVKLEVRWDTGQANQVTLHTVIAEPTRILAGVSVNRTAGAGTLGPDQEATFSATARDYNGDVIPDVFFVWSVRPYTANGTVTYSRDGRTATFRHHYFVPPADNIYYPAGSYCRVQAQGFYLGRERRGYSDPIQVTN